MINLILGLATQVLKLVNEKERSKLHDRLLKAQTELYEEIQKTKPDAAVMDNLEHEIYTVSRSILDRVKS